ncbi:DNA-directed RNA polymerase subunit alpha [bacterium]|nr:DNA-directed RNA polymerase subunit alpha [bacterium]
MNLLNFEMPKGIVVDKKTLTKTYARMDIRPLERGWGHTLGNALRRVILSSLEGAAITTVKIDGVTHEFSTVQGVYEDVTHIILNLKKVLFKVTTKKPFKCTLDASGKGDVTAKKIKVPAGVEILNPDWYICNLDSNGKIKIEMTVEVGRGYRPAEKNKNDDQPVGVIPIDSLFSPIEKVKYSVESARVGNQTDFDGLVLEVWTDGRVEPVQATVQAADLLNEHVTIFAKAADPQYLKEAEPEEEGEEPVEETYEDEDVDDDKLAPSEVSTRTAEALKKSGITSFTQLAEKTEEEVKRIKGIGESSFDELKAALKIRGLSFTSEDEVIAQVVKKGSKK